MQNARSFLATVKLPHLKFSERTRLFAWLVTPIYVLGFFVTGSQSVSAISAAQHQVYDQDVYYYNAAKDTCEASSTSAVAQGSDNQEAAFNYFIGRGLNAYAAAGIVGNLQAESSVIPDTQERNPIAGRGGYGIAQWTGSRRVAIEDYAASSGQDLKSLQFQLDYLYNHDLMGPYKSSVLTPLMSATSVKDASDIFLHHFEAPADQSAAVEDKRASFGEKIYQLYSAGAGAATATATAASAACNAVGSPTTAGFTGFPLQTTKARMSQLNGNCFNDTTQEMCRAGHPYAAYDILADTGTPVLAALSGTVITVTTDKCPGRMVSIYSSDQDVTVSYLHMSVSNTIVHNGDTITAGQNIGFVGAKAEGCGTSHLHIDAATGQPRPGCKREDCPAANAAKFEAGNDKIGLGKSLYQGYAKLQ